jgi:tetratricopeptide (TPR) repeat protein
MSVGWSGGADLRRLFLLAFLLLGLGRPGLCGAQLSDYLQFPQAFPERDLLSVGGTRPEWRKDWESGRRLFRAGDLRGAVESYQRLLLAKANIEEARWELAMILAGLEEWEKARIELELLVEVAPDNVEYLNSLGVALRHAGQFGRALDIFAKVRERFPENFTALVGQAQGLVEAGRKKEALPLIQEIAARKPDDRELSLALATLAYEQGQLELARKLLVSLAAAKKVELDTLLFAARLHDALGKEKEAAGYWEKSLVMDPGNREAHGWLARYLENQGRLDKALPHLQSLLEQEPQNIAILGKICRIYLDSSTRLAEAFPYYEKYVRLRPDDLGFIRSVIDLTTGQEEEQVAFFRLLLAVSPEDLGVFNRLATGWEAAGNPERALAIWERLARLAPERVEVYRALARLLENPGREARLLEVLETIHRLAPDDQEVIGRLARLMVSRGEFTAGLEYYNKLERTGYGGSDLYAGRLAIYEKLGQPSRALADYKKFLGLSPGTGEILGRCLFLAGELGDVTFLVQTAVGLESAAPSGERTSVMLLLADAFARARDFSRALHYYRLVLAGLAGHGEFGSAATLSRQARLGLAQLYRREGLPFEAEQVLREGLLVEVDQGVFLCRLFELSLSGDHPDLENARVWLAQYLGQSQAEPAEAIILQARLLAASGERHHAEEILRQLLNQLQAENARQPAGKSVAATRQAGLLLVEILLDDGELVAAEQQCLVIPGAESDLEVLVLLQDIYLRAGEATAAAGILQGLLQPGTDGIKLLQLVELLHRRGLSADQVAVADKVLGDWPDSLRAGIAKAEALLNEGNNGEARRLGAALAGGFPDSSSVAALNAKLYYQIGQYREALSLCRHILATEPDRFDIKYLMVRCEMAQGNQVEATRLVQGLYPLEGTSQLAKRLTDAGLPLPPPRERTLWQILTFTRPPLDLAVEMLKAGAFFDQSLPERGKVNELVSAMSAWLRWEKKFRAALVGGR